MVNLDAGPVDTMSVGVMRARLMMKIIGLTVMLVLTVMGARSCNGSSKSSPLDPANLLHNGLSGLCANQQAVGAASGDPTATYNLQVPASDAALAQAAGLGGASLSCTTTTTAAAPAG